MCLYHGILQARILESGAVPSSRGSSPSRNQTRISCIVGGFLTTEPPGNPPKTHCATREVPVAVLFTIGIRWMKYSPQLYCFCLVVQQYIIITVSWNEICPCHNLTELNINFLFETMIISSIYWYKFHFEFSIWDNNHLFYYVLLGHSTTKF